ncbi:MAG: glycosyltransferase, partial [Parcubacteria group bacterium]|nr:glycosyltransferase [Parcubacteria group bacterium]
AKDERFELIIVDNGSHAQHKAIIQQIPRLHQPTRIVLNNENFGVAPGWNSGLKLTRGKYICIVSDDFIVGTPDFLRILQKPMLDDPKVVITGPETAQLGKDAMSRQLWRAPLVDYSAVNCCMFRRSFLHKVHYLDENFWPYMGEDADLGWTANGCGKKVLKIDLPGSTHWGSSSVYRYWTNEEINYIWAQNKAYLIDKHKKYLEQRMEDDARYA